MGMLLPPGEPAAGPWRVAPVGELVAVIDQAAGMPVARPRLVAVDGRGGGGKSTAARLLREAVPASAVVHTDDVAWHSSSFGWAPVLAAEGVDGDELAATRFWHEWMAEELPFVADQRPWERACVVVAGTPPLVHGPGQVVLAPAPRSSTAPPVLPQ